MTKLRWTLGAALLILLAANLASASASDSSGGLRHRRQSTKEGCVRLSQFRASKERGRLSHALGTIRTCVPCLRSRPRAKRLHVDVNH